MHVNGEDFARWFLAFYFTCVAVFYTATILIKKRRQGVSPVSAGEPGSDHCWVHRSFTLCRAAIWAVCVGRAAFPVIDRWLIPIPLLWDDRVMIAGVVLLTGSFATIIAIHRYVRQEWHSGIDHQGPARLITTGPFAVSRNPIFLCILTAQTGFFLALPTVFALICLVVGATAVLAQVQFEEAHLCNRFGNTYRAYQTRTPRWL